MNDFENCSDLRGKVIVVTGAFGSLGRAVASRLVHDNARVVMIDKSAPHPDVSFNPTKYFVQGGVDLTQHTPLRMPLIELAHCGMTAAVTPNDFLTMHANPPSGRRVESTNCRESIRFA
jgi:NAD(P)-dependent dehydrogenase (short-subunit alcohol dehydrogenase family)